MHQPTDSPVGAASAGAAWHPLTVTVAPDGTREHDLTHPGDCDLKACPALWAAQCEDWAQADRLPPGEYRMRALPAAFVNQLPGLLIEHADGRPIHEGDEAPVTPELHARTDVPALLAELDWVRSDRDAWKARFERLQDRVAELEAAWAAEPRATDGAVAQAAAAIRAACGHGAVDRCEDCQRCTCHVCTTHKVCPCVCDCRPGGEHA